jgi:hypothetical protein
MDASQWLAARKAQAPAPASADGGMSADEWLAKRKAIATKTATSAPATRIPLVGAADVKPLSFSDWMAKARDAERQTPDTMRLGETGRVMRETVLPTVAQLAVPAAAATTLAAGASPAMAAAGGAALGAGAYGLTKSVLTGEPLEKTLSEGAIGELGGRALVKGADALKRAYIPFKDWLVRQVEKVPTALGGGTTMPRKIAKEAEAVAAVKKRLQAPVETPPLPKPKTQQKITEAIRGKKTPEGTIKPNRPGLLGRANEAIESAASALYEHPSLTEDLAKNLNDPIAESRVARKKLNDILEREGGMSGFGAEQLPFSPVLDAKTKVAAAMRNLDATASKMSVAEVMPNPDPLLAYKGIDAQRKALQSAVRQSRDPNARRILSEGVDVLNDAQYNSLKGDARNKLSEARTAWRKWRQIQDATDLEGLRDMNPKQVYDALLKDGNRFKAIESALKQAKLPDVLKGLTNEAVRREAISMLSSGGSVKGALSKKYGDEFLTLADKRVLDAAERTVHEQSMREAFMKMVNEASVNRSGNLAKRASNYIEGLSPEAKKLVDPELVKLMATVDAIQNAPLNAAYKARYLAPIIRRLVPGGEAITLGAAMMRETPTSNEWRAAMGVVEKSEVADDVKRFALGVIGQLAKGGARAGTVEAAGRIQGAE